jgi:hypothetical protein
MPASMSRGTACAPDREANGATPAHHAHAPSVTVPPMRSSHAIRLGAALALAVSTAASPAQAQVETMRAEMHEFFDGEVAGSWLWFAEGAAATLASAGVLVFYDGEGEDFWRGAAIPVLAIGLVQAATGASILLRTPSWVEDFDARLNTDPAGYRREELERMERINFQYDLVRWVEIILFAGGAGLITYGVIQEDDRFIGAGVGLAAQILFTFLTDIWAASRAHAYTEALQGFTP